MSVWLHSLDQGEGAQAALEVPLQVGGDQAAGLPAGRGAAGLGGGPVARQQRDHQRDRLRVGRGRPGRAAVARTPLPRPAPRTPGAARARRSARTRPAPAPTRPPTWPGPGTRRAPATGRASRRPAPRSAPTTQQVEPQRRLPLLRGQPLGRLQHRGSRRCSAGSRRRCPSRTPRWSRPG